MKPTRNTNPFVRSGVATAAALSLVFTAAGCGDTADDPGVDEQVQEQISQLEDEVKRLDERLNDLDADVVYDGVYGEQFAANVKDWDNQRVIVSGTVEKVVGQDAFTLGGDGVADLLVVSAQGDQQVQEGDTVRVTGTAHATFDLPGVEDDVGRDLDDATFEEWDQGPYVVADRVETDVQPTEDAENDEETGTSPSPTDTES